MPKPTIPTKSQKSASRGRARKTPVPVKTPTPSKTKTNEIEKNKGAMKKSYVWILKQEVISPSLGSTVIYEKAWKSHESIKNLTSSNPIFSNKWIKNESDDIEEEHWFLNAGSSIYEMIKVPVCD